MSRAGEPGGPVEAPGARHRPVALARIVALVALYALALQGVLGGMAAAALGPDRVLCVADQAPDRAGPAGKHLPAPDHGACCVACHVASVALIPAPAPAAAEPVARPVAATAMRPRCAARPRAPPRSGLGARAPPAV